MDQCSLFVFLLSHTLFTGRYTQIKLNHILFVDDTVSTTQLPRSEGPWARASPIPKTALEPETVDLMTLIESIATLVRKSCYSHMAVCDV